MTEVMSAMRSVTVVLAVFRPDATYLRDQVTSLQAQTYPIQKLVVVVADRVSSRLVRELTDHLNWEVHVVVPETETPSYKSFELGLKRAIEVSSEHAFYALCDQDDVWHSTKIHSSVMELEGKGASLVHTDARVIDGNGSLRHKSLFRLENRLLDDDPRRLLLRNSITGMTAMFTHETAKASLPFPSQSALFFHHDLWLGLVASVLQGVTALQEPMVDYRQHAENVVGALETKKKLPRPFSKVWVQHWTASYAVATYLAKCLYLRMQEVTAAQTGNPCIGRLDRLSPYLARHGLGGRMVWDGLKHLVGGRIWYAQQSAMFGVVQAARMFWALRACLQAGTLDALSNFDAKIFAIAPGAQPGHLGAPEKKGPDLWTASSSRDDRMHRKFELKVVRYIGPRVVILVPSLNPSEIFAGIATAIDIGVGLADEGHRVVFVATDLPIASEERTNAFIQARGINRQSRSRGAIELHCGVSSSHLNISAQDRLVATAWWSAHIAADIVRDADLNARQFFYLIQDYEPGFYPWGNEYAGALASYSLDFIPIFNSTYLRDYMREHTPVPRGVPDLTFHPSIDIPNFARLTRAPKKTPRLVIYGRPEVPRNLFPVALEALEIFLTQNELKPTDVEILSVGLKHPDVLLNGGHHLQSLGKIPWDDYPTFLATVDVGLSLMLSPHPSHPPLEMAAAGACVVTNIFSNKDLSELGPQILSVPATPNDTAEALTRAWKFGAATAEERSLDLTCMGRPLAEIVTGLSLSISGSGLIVAKAS